MPRLNPVQAEKSFSGNRQVHRILLPFHRKLHLTSRSANSRQSMKAVLSQFRGSYHRQSHSVFVYFCISASAITGTAASMKQLIPQSRLVTNFFLFLIFLHFPDLYRPNLYIFTRTGHFAGMTADTFSRKRSVSVNLQMCRTALFAKSTFRRTFFTISVKQRRRQYRHHCKNSSHRAKKLTEKTLLRAHPDQNQNK